jgi:phosphatidylglycerol:prolipoprotein diacylglycerol transferase
MRMPFAYWVHNLDPFLIRFSENFGIRYYGLAYLAGFVAAAWLLNLYHKKGRSPLDFGAITDLMTYVVLGVLIGGRLGYYLLYQLGTITADPFALFRVWEGGMASHGGFVGVVVAVWWWARKRNVSMLTVSDLIVSTAPLGLFFGRIANFINAELVGKATTVKWAFIFPDNDIDRALGQMAVPRHPSQLYQAALEGLLLFAYMQWRLWKPDGPRTRLGQLSGEFLIAYAIVRMIGEIFREPDASLILGVSRGTFYSVFLIVAGVVLIIRARNTESATSPAGPTSKT